MNKTCTQVLVRARWVGAWVRGTTPFIVEKGDSFQILNILINFAI